MTDDRFVQLAPSALDDAIGPAHHDVSLDGLIVARRRDETFKIQWDTTVERDVEYVPASVRLLGVDWWIVRHRFRARVTCGPDSQTMTPIAPVVTERAAWWRRLGFAVASRLCRIRRTIPATAPRSST